MRYWVGCTIKTVSTDLSCEIDIGHLREGNKTGYYEWEKFFGRLDMGAEKGDWMYRVGDANKTMAVDLCSTADTKNPYFSNPANTLIELFNVPDRFAEKISCGEYLSGRGTLLRTNEEIVWRMWYPCA